MPIDTLVFCTMVYDWYYMGCNNNTILTPIIAAQCKDPVIIQLVNKYKTEIDIRIKQIVKIVVPPPGDGGGNGNDTNGGNYTGPIADICMGSPPGTNECPPEDGRNEKTSLSPIISPPIDPCIENPAAEGCEPTPPPPIDPCEEDPTAEGCTPPPEQEEEEEVEEETETEEEESSSDEEESSSSEDESSAADEEE
jgi:hypothetical protein